MGHPQESFQSERVGHPPLFRGAGSSVKGEGPDPDVKAFFDSIEVHAEEQNVVVTASLPPRAIQKMLAQPPVSPAPRHSGDKKARAAAQDTLTPATPNATVPPTS